MAIEERLSELFLKNQPMLAEYIGALVRGSPDADDLLQETAITILSKAQAPEDSADFPKWSRGVARNVVLHFWRSRRRDRIVPDSRLVDIIDRAYDEGDEESDLWQAWRRALAICMKDVKGPNRELLQLRYVKGLSSDRIAPMFKKTAVNVRMILHRIRNKLAECMQRHVQAEMI